MTLTSSFRIALRAILGNPLRSVLTMLGVIIGVGSVIAMISIGQGASRAAVAQIQSLGSNLLTVFASPARVGGVTATAQVQTLTLADAEAIEREIAGVAGVSAEFSRSAQAVYAGINTYTQISGVTPGFPEVRNFRPATGVFFGADEIQRRSRVAVLGRTVANALFGETDPVGQKIRIQGGTFTVIGVMESKGASGFGDRDDVIFVPLTTAQTRLFGVKHVRTIYVQVRDAGAMPAVQHEVNSLLLARHRIAALDEADFTVRSQADILEAFTGVARTMTLLLAGVAAVALVVGGIGIMNIMLVSVTERTREIGIRKAVGARRRDILLQFLVESATLGVAGGLIGIALGIAGSRVITRLAGWVTLISLPAIGVAFGFAVAVGVFFGLYPAARAAKLDPIEALRYQ